MMLILVLVKNPCEFFDVCNLTRTELLACIQDNTKCLSSRSSHRVGHKPTRQQLELHPARLRFGTPSHGGLVFSKIFHGFNWVMWTVNRWTMLICRICMELAAFAWVLCGKERWHEEFFGMCRLICHCVQVADFWIVNFSHPYPTSIYTYPPEV